MTHRRRALAALRGEPVDRLPFIGRMELWHHYHRNAGTLPERYRGVDLWDLQRELDIGIFAMGAWSESFFTLRRRRVTVEVEHQGETTTTVYRTPAGDLRKVERKTAALADADVTGLEVEHLFKSPADYDALAYLLDDLEPVENFAAYGKLVEAVGEDGLALPYTGKVPIHQLMENYLGYETFYYELIDRPAEIEKLHEILWAKQLRILELAAASPADAIEVGGNYDEHLTPPPIFARFIQPFYREAKRLLGPAGKPLVVHGDGEMRELLRLLAESDIDAVEAITPAPMTSLRPAEVRRLWDDRVTFWGGIASVVLCPTFSQEAFEAQFDELLASLGDGRRFILGFGDNVPTDADFRRVEQIARFVREHGARPAGSVPLREARPKTVGI